MVRIVWFSLLSLVFTDFSVALGQDTLTIQDQIAKYDALVGLPDPVQARTLLGSIPANSTVNLGDGLMVQLIHFVIDNALWYELSLAQEQELKDWLSSYGVTSTNTCAVMISSLVMLTHSIMVLNKKNRAHVKIAYTILGTSLATFIGSFIAFGTQLSTLFNAAGLENMIGMIQDLMQRGAVLDQTTKDYIDELSSRFPESQVTLQLAKLKQAVL
ncbi:MAG TPA: hypothetical protein VHA52_05895 [Candidatus Babeliaceae bacterium]|nr:hypothetical protein [Candidatus Babeliaceae bacterium]